MTVRYCDFCGDVIPEGTGDPITLADIESMPEARKDACDPCAQILWRFTKDKDLRGTSKRPAEQAAERAHLPYDAFGDYSEKKGQE